MFLSKYQLIHQLYTMSILKSADNLKSLLK
jgi:hypothetical protein